MSKEENKRVRQHYSMSDMPVKGQPERGVKMLENSGLEIWAIAGRKCRPFMNLSTFVTMESLTKIYLHASVGQFDRLF